jgi:hypothetical protein
MAAGLSSMVSYLDGNPKERVSEGQMTHYMGHLQRKEKVCSGVAVAATVLAVFALVGVMGAGHIIFGALLAIALIASLFTYFLKQEQQILRTKYHVEVTPPASLPLQGNVEMT